MDRTLPNNYTKFGAKIFMSYWVITFLVLGHFLSRTCDPVYVKVLCLVMWMWLNICRRNVKYDRFVDIRCFSQALNTRKLVFNRGSEGAYDAPSDPLLGWSPHTLPLSKPSRLDIGASVVRPPTQIPGYAYVSTVYLLWNHSSAPKYQCPKKLIMGGPIFRRLCTKVHEIKIKCACSGLRS